MTTNDKQQTPVECFKIALWLSLHYEGTYVNHPDDRGGPTNRGITQATYNGFRRAKGLGTKSVRFIDDTVSSVIYSKRLDPLEDVLTFLRELHTPDDEVIKIYRERFWNRSKLNELPCLTAIAVFDFDIMTGDDGTRIMQRIIGTTADGIIGPKTLKALRSYIDKNGEWVLVETMLNKREEFHRSVVRRNPSQGKFIDGWLNRTRRIRKALSELRSSQLRGNDY